MKKHVLTVITLLLIVSIPIIVYCAEWEKSWRLAGLFPDMQGGLYIPGDLKTSSLIVTGEQVQTGNYTITGDVAITGELDHTGLLVRTGNEDIIGNRSQIGNSLTTGTVTFIGNVNQLGDQATTGSVGITGNLTSGTWDGLSELRVYKHEFFDVNVSANQSGVNWGRDPSADVGGASFKYGCIIEDGSIIKFLARSNAAITTGTADFEVTRNGTPIGLTVQLNSSNQTKIVTVSRDTYPVSEGDYVGVVVDTSSDLAPTATLDMCATIIAEY